jgi:hypothetical protein
MRPDPDGRLADLIDGSIGEASMFHSTFGYYAQGVALYVAAPAEDGVRLESVPFDAASGRLRTVTPV